MTDTEIVSMIWELHSDADDKINLSKNFSFDVQKITGQVYKQIQNLSNKALADYLKDNIHSKLGSYESLKLSNNNGSEPNLQNNKNLMPVNLDANLSCDDVTEDELKQIIYCVSFKLEFLSFLYFER
jgi:hypothetical protein